MSTVNSSSKGDVNSPSFRGALMSDQFRLSGDRATSGVVDDFAAEIGRASVAIQTLSRLVHNSLSEPQMSGAEPLGNIACRGLMCALEIVGSHIGDVAENLNDWQAGIEHHAAEESSVCDGLVTAAGAESAREYPSGDTTAEYVGGIRDGLDLLAQWSELGEYRLSPPELTKQWLAALSERDGDARQGVSDTVAAYFIIAMEGGAPVLENWDAAHELAHWEVSDAQ